MDLFGKERAKLRAELEELRHRQEKTAAGAERRQAKVHELEKIIDQLKADLYASRSRSAPAAEVDAAEAALRDAVAIHGKATR